MSPLKRGTKGDFRSQVRLLERADALSKKEFPLPGGKGVRGMGLRKIFIKLIFVPTFALIVNARRLMINGIT